MVFILGLIDTTTDKLTVFTDIKEANDFADEWVAIDAPDVETAVLHYEDAFTNWQKNTPVTPYVVVVGQTPTLKTEFELSK